MLRGYRCAVFALVGFLISAASPPEPRASGNQQRADSRIEQSLQEIAASLKEAKKPEQPDPGCEQGKDNRSSDLCAQWKAADAAYEGAVWTRRAFYLAVAGLVIGGFTLIAAGFAAWYAREAARQTRRIGEAQTRAYPVIEELVIGWNERGTLISGSIANTGNSPALAGELVIEITYFTQEGLKQHFLSVDCGAIPTAGQKIGPIVMQELKIDRTDFGAIRQLTVNTLLFCEDVFGVELPYPVMFSAGAPDHLAYRLNKAHMINVFNENDGLTLKRLAEKRSQFRINMRKYHAKHRLVRLWEAWRRKWQA